LRHTCASLSVSTGVNVLALQRMLGHQSAKVTLDTYSDLFHDDLDAVATTLDKRYSPEIVAELRPWARADGYPHISCSHRDCTPTQQPCLASSSHKMLAFSTRIACAAPESAIALDASRASSTRWLAHHEALRWSHETVFETRVAEVAATPDGRVVREIDETLVRETSRTGLETFNSGGE
jgi:hypothetical protein